MPLISSASGSSIDVSVVIPCLDEAANARLYDKTLLAPLNNETFSSEIIFSDGGSADGTVSILSSLETENHGVRVLRADGPSSFAGSIARALPLCRGEYICLTEADLSFSPADIGRLLTTAREGSCDCVFGSPFRGSFEGLTFGRLALTRSANFLLRLRFGRRITSYTQIFKIFRAEILRGLDFESAGFSLDAEITAKCLRRGLRIEEIPVTMKARTLGASKIRAAAETADCLKLMIRGVSAPVRPG